MSIFRTLEHPFEGGFMLARIRKAVLAGLGAGITAGITTLVQDGAPTKDQVSKALGVALVAAVTIGWGTWRIENAKPKAPA
jgi:hypothetical protein